MKTKTNKTQSLCSGSSHPNSREIDKHAHILQRDGISEIMGKKQGTVLSHKLSWISLFGRVRGGFLEGITSAVTSDFEGWAEICELNKELQDIPDQVKHYFWNNIKPPVWY